MRTRIKFLLIGLIGGLLSGCSGPHLYESEAPTEAQKAAAAAKKRAEPLDPALAKYLGKYKMQEPTPGFDYLAISRDENTLIAWPAGDEKFELYPLSENEFNVPGAMAKISFIRNGSAAAEELVLTLNGNLYRGRKEYKASLTSCGLLRPRNLAV